MPKKIGRLKSFTPTSERTREGAILWECECKCGKKFKTRYSNLRSGKTTSCGCARRDRQRAAVTRHGLSAHPVYRVYHAMVDRCTNPNDGNYRNYGAIGISVCDRWLGPRGFDHFIADMGVPESGMSIERKEVTRGYSPDNCEWMPLRLQNRNKRSTIKVELDGKLVPLAEVAERFGLSYKTLYTRYRFGIYSGGVPNPVQQR